jgi:transcriptional regulator with XRE-family HTH domain
MGTKMKLDKSSPRRRLVFLRKVLGLTQKEFSARAGIPLRSYQKIEYGEMDLNTDLIFKISDQFPIRPSFFFKVYEPIEKGPLKNEFLADGIEHKIIHELRGIIEGHKSQLTPRSFLTSENSLKAIVLNKNLQSTLDAKKSKYASSNTGLDKELLSLWFCHILNNTEVYSMGIIEHKFNGTLAHKTISINYLAKKSFDKPEVRSHHVDISQFPEPSESDMKTLCASLSKQINSDILLLPPLV